MTQATDSTASATLSGRELALKRRKAMALLAYLAVTGRSHSRDSLATLLWPELDQSTARARLRRAMACGFKVRRPNA